MRIHRYAGDDGIARVAIDGGRGPIDLERAWANHAGAPPSLVRSTFELIEHWEEAEETIRHVVFASSDVLDTTTSWLCPFDRIGSLRDFLAFEDHVKAGARRRGGEVPAYWYEAPVYYKGNHRSLLGPDQACPWPAYTEKLDFELELAMVVGRRGRDISPGDAGSYIFGFTIFNDFSARDVQSSEMSAWLGPAKGKDFANAFGPAIVTVDELGAEPDVTMSCRVNGDEWGRARSSDARWKWADTLAHVSRGEDIWPGDVYGSGTPGGCCGLDLGRALAPGDVVELEIEGIGVLTNPVGDRE